MSHRYAIISVILFFTRLSKQGETTLNGSDVKVVQLQLLNSHTEQCKDFFSTRMSDFTVILR